MKRNLYYRSVFRRRNILKEGLLGFFYDFCSYPRLLLEVFIKKNFGERYFSFSAAVTVAIILVIIPFPIAKSLALLISYSHGQFGNTSYETGYILGHFVTWYLYVIVFLLVASIRKNEIRHLPSVSDSERFSLYQGELIPALKKFLISRGNTDPRTREIFIEPAIFFISGVILAIFGQFLGLLLIVCSLFYSFSYMGAYHQGDHFVMDIIDEMILNEELENAFVNDEDAANTRGVKFYAKKPNGTELRRKVGESFIDDDTDKNISVAV